MTKPQPKRVKASDIELDLTESSSTQKYIKRFGKRPEVVISHNFIVPSLAGDTKKTYFGAGPAGTDKELLIKAVRLKISVNVRPE